MGSNIKTIAIVAPANLPIPATRGGAIEVLVQHIIDCNEISKKLNIEIVSRYDDEAYKASLKYCSSHFVWYSLHPLIERLYNGISTRILKYFKVDIGYYRQLVIFFKLKKNNYDFIVLENDFRLARLISRFLDGKKVIMHLHNRFDNIKFNFSTINKTLAVSEYVRKELILSTNVSPNKVFVFRNCINLNNFSINPNARVSNRKKLGLETDDIAICFCGRLVELKGIMILVQAFKSLTTKYKYIKLVLIGSLGASFGESYRSYTPFITSLIEQIEPIKDRVIFTGFIHNDNLPEVLNAMDIAVMPSLYKEAAAVNNLEYQAVGLPIVTTNNGGIPEYVTKESAKILSAGDYLQADLTNALDSLIQSPEIRKEMGQAGILNSKQFAVERYYEEFVDFVM